MKLQPLRLILLTTAPFLICLPPAPASYVDYFSASTDQGGAAEAALPQAQIPINRSIAYLKKASEPAADIIFSDELARQIRIISGAGSPQVEQSVERSNSGEYKDYADAAYRLLIQKVVWDYKDDRPGVLFLEGVKELPSEGAERKKTTTALPRLGLVVVSADEFGGILAAAGKERALGWLAENLAHEAAHVRNFRRDAEMPRMRDEALAVDARYRAIDGRDRKRLAAYKNYSKALAILSSGDKQNLVCAMLGISVQQYRDLREAGAPRFPRNNPASPTVGIPVAVSAGGAAARVQTIWVNTLKNYIWTDLNSDR